MICRTLRSILHIFALLLVLAHPASAKDEAPAIPSSACLECHNDPTLDMKKAGKKVSLFVDEALFKKSVHSSLACVDCHENFNPEGQPHKSPMTAVDCGSCHEGLGKKHSFHKRLGLKEIPKGSDTSCTTCHGSHNIQATKAASSPFAKSRQNDTCGSCHISQKATLLDSAHGKPNSASAGIQPLCLDCHKNSIVPADSAAPDAQTKLAQVALCESCHVAKEAVANNTVLGLKFVASFDKSVHGAALHEGKAAAASCVDCHGSHGTNPAMAASSKVNLKHVAETCSKCHAKQASAYQSSIHASALAKGNVDSPTCTRCHGEHDIKSRNDPSATTYSKNLSQQICASCHGSVRLAKKYGLASDRFSTFSDSYHGLAVRGGAVEVVNCASCHGSHSIKSQNDPSSNINKNQLVQTCGNCHPGASTGFTIGKVHASENQRDQEPILYWVSTLYVILIIVVVGGMALHNLLDFIKKARRKLLIQKGLIVEHHIEHRLYLRMTGHERLQHATLVISFVLLVLTGFMLRYPEAWWVVAIQHISKSAFAWRAIIHRIAGVVMLVGGVWHISYLAFSPQGRSLFMALLPRWNDLTDPFKVLRYNLGLSPDKPQFGRFCYVEKAEYWALVWGTLLMGLTGAILWFDNTSMGIITKLGFDVARSIHFYEAILATLAIIVWHFYFVIFNPDVYPMNLSWLTGRMSEREMFEEHPAELLRIKTEEAKALAAPPLTELPEEEKERDQKPDPRS